MPAAVLLILAAAMFPSYLRMALACDLENPHRSAGCVEPTPHERKVVGGRQQAAVGRGFSRALGSLAQAHQRLHQ